MPRGRTLSEQDRSDWTAFARSVAALPGRATPETPPALPAPARRAEPPPAPNPLAPPALPRAPLAVGEPPAGLDSGTWNRFRTGRIQATRTLDLHGRTAQRAFFALHAFLQAAHADRLRCVEVITGRGAGEAGGVLRRELPLWLNLPELRPLVLAASHPHAANPGAVRLLLRRPR